MDNTILDSFLRQSHLTKDISKSLHSKFGVNYFTYLEIHDSGEFLAFVNDYNYFENVIDLLFKYELYMSLPYWYLNNFQQTGSYLSILNDSSYATEKCVEPISAHGIPGKHDYGNLYSIVDNDFIDGKRIVKIFSYGGHKNDVNINKRYLKNVDLFNQFCAYYYKRMLPVILNTERVVLSDGYISNFKKMMMQFNIKKETLESIRVQDKVIKVKQDIKKLNITKREQQIIAEYMQGLNSKKTADKLFVSKKTVERHFENIRNKLNAHSKDEIVAKLMDLGYFYFQ
jgi:DNA-binding CsgD family transcriptional regulator